MGRKHCGKRRNCSLQCFQKTCTADTYKPRLVWERVNSRANNPGIFNDMEGKFHMHTRHHGDRLMFQVIWVKITEDRCTKNWQVILEHPRQGG